MRKGPKHPETARIMLRDTDCASHEVPILHKEEEDPEEETEKEPEEEAADENLGDAVVPLEVLTDHPDLSGYRCDGYPPMESPRHEIRATSAYHPHVRAPISPISRAHHTPASAPTHRTRQTTRMGVHPPEHTFYPPGSTYHRRETSCFQEHEIPIPTWGIPAPVDEPPFLSDSTWLELLTNQVIEQSVSINNINQHMQEMQDTLWYIQREVRDLQWSNTYYSWRLDRVTIQLKICTAVITYLVVVAIWLLYYTHMDR